jgi:Flp pilus assembly protein TadB
MPFTLFDWGEGERDIRLLHDAVPGIDGDSGQQAVVDGAPARLGRTSGLSKPVGWFVVVIAGIMLALGLVNLVVNTERIASWLPLLVLMPFALIVVLRDLMRR